MLNFTRYLFCALLFAFPCWSNAEEINGASWMQEIGDDTELSRITMPGTHDSGALHGRIFAQCQNLTITQQLDAGVRFLDIRCKVVKGEFRIFHGIADQKMSFVEVRDVCEAFVKAHPTETIVMSIKDEGSRGLRKGQFGRLLKKYVKPQKALWYQKNEVPQLKDVRGKIVVVSRNSEVDGIQWKDCKIQDAYRVSGKKEIAQKWQKFLAHSKLAKESKQGWYINYASGTGLFSTPNVVAGELNPKILKLYQKAKPHYQGVIMLDFATKALADEIIKLNEAQKNEQ